MSALRLVATAAILVCGLGSAPVRAQAPDPVEARAFEIRYRAPADAQELVSPILSSEGSITVQPKLKTIVVQDRRSILERVSGLIASFDLPPRSVEVQLSLFLGTDRREQEAGRHVPSEALSREVRGVTETLGDFTKWNAYQLLGGRVVTGVEGSQGRVDLSDEYRVLFELDTIDERQGVKLHFKRFTLQRVGRDEAGRERVQDLYTTQIVIPAGRTVMVGAAQNPESKRALFLTLQARPK